MHDAPPPGAAASDAGRASQADPHHTKAGGAGGAQAGAGAASGGLVGRAQAEGAAGTGARADGSPRAQALRRTATLLGLGGLLPFAALALAAAWLDGDWALAAADAQVQYAASILSFIGALHWGVALAAPTMSSARTRLALVWSVMPSLYAWATVTLPRWAAGDSGAARTSLTLLAAGLVLAWAVDQALYRGHPVPAWFRRLRAVLTAGATLALLATLLVA